MKATNPMLFGFADSLMKLAGIELKWDAAQQKTAPGQRLPSAQGPQTAVPPQEPPALPEEVLQVGMAQPSPDQQMMQGGAVPQAPGAMAQDPAVMAQDPAAMQQGMVPDPVEAENQRLQSLVDNAQLRLKYTQLEKQVEEAKKSPTTKGAADAAKAKASGKKSEKAKKPDSKTKKGQEAKK